MTDQQFDAMLVAFDELTPLAQYSGARMVRYRRSPTATRPQTRARNNGPRPAAARSSARSGDSGDSGSDSDPDPEPEPAPPAAREAVAVVWGEVLRRRHP